MGRRLPVPTAIVATVAFVAVTLSACSGAGPLTPATSEASPRPTHASPPPGGSGPPPSGDCVSISAGSSRAPWTIESIRTDASAVVVGTLTARDPARWTTPDGQRPVMSPGRSIDAVLWTPLVLADGRTIFGDVEGRPIGVIGGTSGCDSYSNRDVAMPELGRTLVLILFAVNSGPGRTSDILAASEIWTVGDDDLVQPPAYGAPVPLAEIVRRLRP